MVTWVGLPVWSALTSPRCLICWTYTSSSPSRGPWAQAMSTLWRQPMELRSVSTHVTVASQGASLFNLLAELPDVLLTRPPQLAAKYAPLAHKRHFIKPWWAGGGGGGGLLGKSNTNTKNTQKKKKHCSYCRSVELRRGFRKVFCQHGKVTYVHTDNASVTQMLPLLTG